MNKSVIVKKKAPFIKIAINKLIQFSKIKTTLVLIKHCFLSTK